MNNDYRTLTENINRRINPENLRIEKSFADELATIAYSDVLTYIRLAMKSVDSAYTKVTLTAGERVKDHLSTLENVEFRYQGSVMTNTHIRSYSDIDILVISKNFYFYDAENSNRILDDQSLRNQYYTHQIELIQKEKSNKNYEKNTLSELRQLRLESENILGEVYSVCDLSKPKSIKVTNLNLHRDVDVVIANWYDDVMSIINNKGDFRGVQVYNKKDHVTCPADFPFLSIYRINEKSARAAGRLKKMIRFLKNLKVKSAHDIKLSSFDFNAICYDINIKEYEDLAFYQLVAVLYKQLKNLSINKTLSDNLVSVDGREWIFRYNQEKLESLSLLLAELEGVYRDLNNSNNNYHL